MVYIVRRRFYFVVFEVYRRCFRRLAEGCCNFEAAFVLNVYGVLLFQFT